MKRYRCAGSRRRSRHDDLDRVRDRGERRGQPPPERLHAWIPDPDRPDIRPQERFIWASYAVTDDEDPGRLPVNIEWHRGPADWHVGADRYDTQTAAIETALRIGRGR